MNWAKKLLTAGDCPRCGGRLEDLGDGQVSCDTCSYPEPEEEHDCLQPDEHLCCVGCAGLDCETCPMQDGTKRPIDPESPEGQELLEAYRDDEEDEDDPPQYCDQCGNVIPDGETWCLDVRDGTEHFCCAECQHERAAEIEAAPLCAWCHEKCDQGVVNSVHSPDNSAPFCSTECLEQYRKSTAHGVAVHVCAHCGKPIDGPRYISARCPELKFCSERCRDDYVSKHLNPFNS